LCCRLTYAHRTERWKSRGALWRAPLEQGGDPPAGRIALSRFKASASGPEDRVFMPFGKRLEFSPGPSPSGNLARAPFRCARLTALRSEPFPRRQSQTRRSGRSADVIVV
jgi:hypothetical protein